MGRGRSPDAGCRRQHDHHFVLAGVIQHGPHPLVQKIGIEAGAAQSLHAIFQLGALGGHGITFMGLAGMGDLILTCTGDLSRNRRVGLMLAEGLSLDTVLQKLGHVAEGVSTAREAAALARRMGVDMPITRAVNAILYDHAPVDAAIAALLARPFRPEGE